MSFLGRISIKNKIVLIIMLVCSIITGFGLFIVFLSNVNSMKKNMVNSTIMNAKLIGEYCSTALSFQYPERAEEILEKLESLPEILNGYVYDQDSKLFATYTKTGEQPVSFSLQKKRFHLFEGNYLHVCEPIVYMGKNYGTIYLRAFTSLTEKIRNHFFVMLSLMLSLLLLSYLFATIFQRIISRPILKLAEISGTISSNRDYSLRAERKSDDEIGVLCHEFNNMLDVVQAREKELRHLRNYLSNIIDSMPSVLVGVDIDGQVTLWNKTAEQTTGITASEAQGKQLTDVFPQIASDMKKITESIRTRKTKQEQKRPRLLEDGTCYEDVTIYPLISNGVEGAVIRADDVTEQIRLEEIMIQSEKMLSVGGLAAGMAHEINNPLAGMMQTANVMANRLGNNVDIPANLKAAEAAGTSMETIRNFMEARGILRMINTINESGQRVADIVDNMLSFARKSEAQASSHTLTDLLDKTLDLAATDYDLKKHYDFKTIEIRKEYEKNLPTVPCEGAKIQQVLLNILRNGAQAMQEAGTKTPLFIVHTRFEKSRKMVCIEIEDNGPGMEEEIRKRVFEPFYTTKPVGVGTGLGMSVSYFIITENHGGEMTVDSRPGFGAKFIIRLPLEGRKV